MGQFVLAGSILLLNSLTAALCKDLVKRPPHAALRGCVP